MTENLILDSNATTHMENPNKIPKIYEIRNTMGDSGRLI